MRKWEPVPNHPNIFSYETAKGTRYGTRIGYQDINGRRKEFSKSGFRNWRVAEGVLRDFQSDVVNGRFDKIEAGKVSLDQVWALFVMMKESTGTWRTSTKLSYTMFYTSRIQPRFGHRRIGEIKRAEVQRLFTDLADPELVVKSGTHGTKKGLAKETVASVYTVFMALVNYAVRNDLLDKNRFAGIKITGRERQKKMVSPLEQARWLDTAQKVLTPYAFACVRIIASTGMRRGEALGLRTNSVQFVNNDLDGSEYALLTLDLQRTITEPLGTKLKTDSSYRRIAVSGSAVDALHYAIEQSNLIRRQTNQSPDKPTWLWLNRNGAAIAPTSVEAWFRKTSETCSIKVTPHMLRHYFATQAVASGKPQIDVMHYLGHSNLQMTADYTRGTDAASLAVSQGFEAVTRSLGGTKAVQSTQGGTKIEHA